MFPQQSMRKKLMISRALPTKEGCVSLTAPVCASKAIAIHNLRLKASSQERNLFQAAERDLLSEKYCR